MTKFGEVTEYNPRTGMSTIRYARPEACEKCGACGTASHQGTVVLQANCNPGRWVRIELPDQRFLQATATAYLVPLGALLLGLVLGSLLGGDLWTLAGGFLFLALSLVFLRLYDKRLRNREGWSPRVVEVYTDKPTPETMGCFGGE